jgi:16S rRNA (guanine966-N2)-methyltransferase
VLSRPVEKLVTGVSPAVFDLVYADPPYKLETVELQEVLTALAANGWLAEDAVVVVERGKREPWEWPEGFAALRDRKYGEARLWYGHRHEHGTAEGVPE